MQVINLSKDMSSKNDANWYQNYEALKVYIQERGHLPDKHVEGPGDRYLIHFD